ncbi:hypothetical protein BDN72DRAFT_906720, partial [Pluteus cervinus]
NVNELVEGLTNGALKESTYKCFTNRAGVVRKTGHIDKPNKAKTPQLRRTNGQRMFEAATKDTLNEEMNKEILHRNFDALPEEEQQKYRQKAEEHNKTLLLPPTEEEILVNHEHLEDDIRKFVDNTLGTDSRRKHGNGVLLVLGAFNHGLERKNVCVVGVNGKCHADFVIPKEARKPLLFAMRDYLDLHHPLIQQGDPSSSDVTMSEASSDTTSTPTPLATTVTSTPPISASLSPPPPPGSFSPMSVPTGPSPPDVTMSEVDTTTTPTPLETAAMSTPPISASLSPPLPARLLLPTSFPTISAPLPAPAPVPLPLSDNTSTSALATDVASLGISLASAMPTSTGRSGSVTPEVIKAALRAVYLSAVMIEAEDLGSGEDFTLPDATVNGDEVPSSKAKSFWALAH